MFAARANQENTIHHPQNAKSLAPKTPSGKTPFHGGGKNNNNENALQLPGKAGGGGDKPDRNAFVTPANPRTRAPLGNKTTNAKGGILQPAATATKPPASSGAKTRRNHPKIKVHASTTSEAENVLEQEREIEYMPPRSIPLRDHELDEEIFPHDRDLSCLQGRNLTRGWYSEYAQPRKDDDEGELSDFAEKLRKAERKRKQVATAKVGTVKARGAVGALSNTKPSGGAALRGGERKSLTTAMGKPSTMRGAAPVNSRFAAAKVASNSTIGYSKGRVVSRPKLNAVVQPEKKTTALDDLLTGFGDLGIDDEEADMLGLGGGQEIRGEDEDEEVFQLEVSGEDV